MKLKYRKRALRYNLITYGMVIFFYVLWEIMMNTGNMSSLMKGMLVSLCYYSMLAVSLNLVVGISGELSLGHAGFMLPEASHHRFVFGPRAGMLKYSPAGWECAVAVAAAEMAAMGEYADREIFDGEHGFWAMQGTPKRLEEWLTKDLGTYYAIRDVRYKPRPAPSLPFTFFPR